MIIKDMQASKMLDPHVGRCGHHRHVETAMQQVRDKLARGADL